MNGFSGSEFSGPEDDLYRYLLEMYGEYMSVGSDSDMIGIAMAIRKRKSTYANKGLEEDTIREIDESARKASGYTNFHPKPIHFMAGIQTVE